LTLAPATGGPAGHHPVVIEQMSSRGTYGSSGTVTSQDVGGFAGEVMGAMAGALFGKAAMGAAAQVGKAVGRELTGAATDLAGATDETMVRIPNVRKQSGGSAVYSFVLGMDTDNRLAKMGDDSLGYGYGKRVSRISSGQSRLDGFSVSRGGETVFRAENSNGRFQRASLSALGDMGKWLKQPLLGVDAKGQYAVSFLQRDLGSAAYGTVKSQLEVAPAFAGGIGAGNYSGMAIQLKDMKLRLTTPDHYSLRSLP
jgi:hypothetical protein